MTPDQVPLKPEISPEGLQKLRDLVPHMEQITRHGLEAGLGANQSLVSTMAKLANYYWVTGSLEHAESTFTKLAEILVDGPGEEHPVTIITKARLEAVKGEMRHKNAEWN